LELRNENRFLTGMGIHDKGEKKMTTKNNLEQPVSARPERNESTQAGTLEEAPRRRGVLRLGGALSAAALMVGLIGSYILQGQPSGLQIIPLAQGYSPDQAVNLLVHGPSDALQTDLVFQQGGETGWHYHPGPVVVVVKTGALTEIHSDGCVTVHPAGSAFFEMKDEIHNAKNEFPGVTEVYATFLSPAGAQPLIPASNPGNVCHGNR
jgi:quercetin dioxygenase-like cupin family protein